jgi:hypothetical protein
MLADKLNLKWHKEWRKQVVDAFVACRDIDMGEHVEIPITDWERLQNSLMQAPSRTLPFVDTVEQLVREPFMRAKNQPCGCVICTCENDAQCQGCGARYCGIHKPRKGA